MSIVAVDPYGSQVTIPESVIPVGDLKDTFTEPTDSLEQVFSGRP